LAKEASSPVCRRSRPPAPRKRSADGDRQPSVPAAAQPDDV